jgi:hypothetical protein
MPELILPEGSVRHAMLQDVIIDGFRDGGPIEAGIIQGPVESGKSVGTAGSLYAAICNVPPWDNGVRRSRWLVTRNTYADLERSTLKTWLDWFPESDYGNVKGREPYTHEMKFEDVDAEVTFMSFEDDRLEILRRLRSMELTGCWINEGQYFSRKLFFAMAQRCGRYPPVAKGGSGRKLMLMDMNAPESDDHWVLRMRGDVELPDDMPQNEKMAYEKPDWLEFYVQPPALIQHKDKDGAHLKWTVNPEAENIEHMTPDNYLKLADGRTMEEIRRDLCNEVVEGATGTPCYPSWDRDRHSTAEIIEPHEGSSLILGFDWGTTPSCTIWQNVAGQWLGIAEIVESNTRIIQFAPKVKRFISQRFPWAVANDGPGVIAWGDPQGGWGNEHDGNTSFKIMRSAAGIIVRAPAEKDSPQTRLEIGDKLMTETLSDGRPRILCSRHPTRGMPRFCKAMAGGYVLKKFKVEGTEKTKTEVVKNSHSHVAESGAYAWWGGGEGRATLRGTADRPTKINVRDRAKELGRRRIFSHGRR